MSNTTSFIANNLGELSTIFNPWSRGTQATLTYYKYWDGTHD